MANIPTFDPLSSEVRSPLIAGLTEGLNKISNILNMATAQYTDLPLEEVYITEDKKHLLYQASFGNRLWLETPIPVIKVNGTVATVPYDLDPIGGSVRFETPLNNGDVVTVTATGITANSAVISNILTDLQAVESIAEKYKGYYSTENGLKTEYPTGTDGDYAIIGSTNSVWVWNSTAGRWKDTFRATDLSAYLTESEISSTYAKKADVSSTYATKTEVSNTYETKSNASTTYATKNDVADTYATKTDVANTYETKSNASATYATKTEVTAVQKGAVHQVFD